MERFAHYGWPFFEPRHEKLAREAEAWATQNLAHAHGEDADGICRRLVQDLGCAGYLSYSATETPDVRSIALLREVFAYHAGLADFAFVMQGLGSGAIGLAGTAAQKEKYLAKAARGEAIAAFALSEPDAGSDVQAISTRARKQGAGWVLDGTKTWISNGGIADFYVTFARAEEGISAFVVEAKDVDASERIDIVAPHPMAVIRLKDSAGTLLGEIGQGFKLAMRNLDVFRTTVAAAALGFARRALDEALARARERGMFGQKLADFQLTQAKLARMAVTIQGARQFAYAVARMMAKGQGMIEAAMVKAYVCRAAEWVTREAMQIHGGYGYAEEYAVSRYFVDARVLSIFEGADETLALKVIARRLVERAAR